MQIPSVVRAVVFDLDRTLLDHDSAAQGAVRDWLSELGVALEEIPALSMLWLEAGQRQAARFRGGELSYHEHRRERVRELMRALGWAYSPRRADTMFRSYLGGYARHWVAYDDAASVLRWVRNSGRVVAVLTNGDIVQQRAKLRQIGLLDLCDDVFASSQLPAGKPDPRAFQTVAKLTHLAPAECLMVGDDLDIDIRGALNAGWHAVHVNRSSPPAPPNGSRNGTEKNTENGSRYGTAHRIEGGIESGPVTIHSLSELTPQPESATLTPVG